ncbi:MAG TPA: hypothetical protein DDW55_15020 [Gammaproteobacteria bacterium]|nr:hypothetical protein [Gammaproteobacteria bacterium]
MVYFGGNIGSQAQVTKGLERKISHSKCQYQQRQAVHNDRNQRGRHHVEGFNGQKHADACTNQ